MVVREAGVCGGVTHRLLLLHRLEVHLPLPLVSFLLLLQCLLVALPCDLVLPLELLLVQLHAAQRTATGNRGE